METIPVSWLTLVTFCTLLASLFVQLTTATCSQVYGPSGMVECLNLYPYYQNRSQWATCLTDVYIRHKSKRQHACVDTTTKYCLYQYPSPVYNDCVCGSGPPQTTQQSIPASTLPPWCLSPNGEQCSWYTDCLEKRYPCKGTAGAYAITYAETFCNLYRDHAPSFSQTGQDWTNAVRKCLQVALVPILRPWVTITCDGIRQMAFNSYSDCYLSPYSGAPSICNLPAGDWWKIFWTIKSELKSTFVEALKGAIEVLKGCGGLIFNNLVDMIKLEFNILRESPKRDNRSTSEVLNELAGAVADAIGSRLGWIGSGVIWYAYSNSSTSSSIVPVHVLITWNGRYNLNNIQGANVNLTAVTERVVIAAQKGALSFSNIWNGTDPIFVKQMKACTDFACLKTTNEVKAPEKPAETNSATELISHYVQTTNFLLLILIFVALQ